MTKNKVEVNMQYELSAAILSVLYNQGKITKDELEVIDQKNKIIFCD